MMNLLLRRDACLVCRSLIRNRLLHLPPKLSIGSLKLLLLQSMRPSFLCAPLQLLDLLGHALSGMVVPGMK